MELPTPDDTTVERWRNIGIVAHINAGKTTLSERVLFDSGRQRWLGDVDAGTAALDWQREEQERGISIDAAVTDVSWRGHRIQLVDTPGHVDFTAEVERALRVLDGAIVVVDGVRGVEPQTESVWRLLDELAVPRLAFVNKLDRAASDFDRSVEHLTAAFGCAAVPLVRPLPSPDGTLGGLLDAVGGHHVVWDGPAPEPAAIDAARSGLIDCCADRDPEVLAQFVEHGHVDARMLHAALRRLTLAREIVPVFGGSALENRGIEPLLDGVCRYLPSPLERARDHAGDAAGPLVAFVFKSIEVDADRPAMPLVRVFRGSLAAGDEVETGAGATARIGGLYSVHAIDLAAIGRAGPGAIVGVEASVPLRSGETLRAAGTDVVLEPIAFSEPVLSIRVEPAAPEDLPALEAQAAALAAGDPTLRIGRDAATGSLLVSGMGELHLDVFRERLERRLGLSVRCGAPAVLRYETVSTPARGVAECERALGATRIRAAATVLVEPAPESGVRFRWALARTPQGVTRDELLAELAALAESGLHAAVPLRDVALELVEVTTGGPPEMAAGLVLEAIALACRRAVEAAGPRLLEPRVRFVVDAPAEHTSGVLADLRARGARIEEVLPTLSTTTLRGTAALARLLGYATALRSMTRGRARFELAPDGLAPCP